MNTILAQALRTAAAITLAAAAVACGGSVPAGGEGGSDGASTTALDTDALTCSDVLGAGPNVTGLVPGLAPSVFGTPAAARAYTTLEACACGPSASCVDACDVGGPGRASFCNGAAASTECAECLVATCAQLLANCAGN